MSQSVIVAVFLIGYTNVFAAANDGYRLCRSTNPGCTAGGSIVAIDSGTEVNEWCTCKTISNTSAQDVFIPTKTETEYLAFLTHLPPNVMLGACTTNGGEGAYRVTSDQTAFNVRGCDQINGTLNGGGGGGGGTSSGNSWRAGTGRRGGRVVTGDVTIATNLIVDVVVGLGGRAGTCIPQPVSGGAGGYSGGSGDDNANGVAGTAGGGATGNGGNAGTSGGSSNGAGAGNYGGGGGGGDNVGNTSRHGGGGGGATVIRINGGADLIIAGGGGAGGGSNTNTAGDGGRACNGSTNGSNGGNAGGNSAGGGGGGGACYQVNGSPTYSNNGGTSGAADGACNGAGEGGDGSVNVLFSRTTALP